MTRGSAPPRWASVSAAVAIHAEAIGRYGGLEGIRDLGLLESAMARPKNRWEYEDDPDAFDLAAAYAFGVIRNHPFLDGNKRTGMAVAGAFLRLAGWDLAAEPREP